MRPWPFSQTIRRPMTSRAGSSSRNASLAGYRGGRNRDRGGPQQCRRSRCRKLFQDVDRPSENGFAGVEKALRLARAIRSCRLAILHVPPSYPSRPVGTGDRMVQQVNRRRPYKFFPLVDLAAANAWPSRQEAKRRPSAKAYPALPSDMAHPLDRQSDSTRNTRASSRPAQGRLPEAKRKRTDLTIPPKTPCASLSHDSRCTDDNSLPEIRAASSSAHETSERGA